MSDQMVRRGVAEVDFRVVPHRRYTFRMRGIPEGASWTIHDGPTLDDPVLGEVAGRGTEESWRSYSAFFYRDYEGPERVRRFLISTDAEVVDFHKVAVEVECEVDRDGWLYIDSMGRVQK